MHQSMPPFGLRNGTQCSGGVSDHIMEYGCMLNSHLNLNRQPAYPRFAICCHLLIHVSIMLTLGDD